MNFKNMTFDELDEFSVRNLVVETKEISSILKAHLFVEGMLDSLIEQQLTNPESLFKNQLSFTLKLDLAYALGIIPKKLLSPIRTLNRIRNKYAHNLDYEVSLKELNSLKLNWSDIQKKAYEVSKEEGLNEALTTASIFLCWSILNLKDTTN